MTKTLLVDGTYLFKICSFVTQNDISKSAITYSFLTKLRKLISENNINKCVVCWDGENSGKQRYLLYRDYKANRKNKEFNDKLYLTDAQIKDHEKRKESELYQLIRIKNYLEELYIRQVEADEVEGDDLIAYYVQTFNNNEEIIIYSNDKDLFQLLPYNAKIYSKINGGEVLIDKYSFDMYFPYYYENILTIKILCGDNSDNIKGIKGMGEATLFKLFPEILKRKVSVNEIYKEAIKILQTEKKPKKIYESLVNSRDQLILNQKIIDLTNPLLTDDARQIVKDLNNPLDPTNRNSINLHKLMQKDMFLNNYNSDFISYVKPFFTIISNEKNIYEKSKV